MGPMYNDNQPLFDDAAKKFIEKGKEFGNKAKDAGNKMVGQAKTQAQKKLNEIVFDNTNDFPTEKNKGPFKKINTPNDFPTSKIPSEKDHFKQAKKLDDSQDVSMSKIFTNKVNTNKHNHKRNIE